MADKQKRINRYLEEILSKNRPSERDPVNDSRSDMGSYIEQEDPQPGRSAQFYESDQNYSESQANNHHGYDKDSENHLSAKLGDQYSQYERHHEKKQDFMKDASADIDYNEKFKSIKNTFNAQPDISQYDDSQYQTYYSKRNDGPDASAQSKANFKKNNYLDPGIKHEFEGSSDKRSKHQTRFDIGNDDDICMSFNQESSQRKPVNNLVNNYKYKDQESLSMNNEPERRRYQNYQTSLQSDRPVHSQDYGEKGINGGHALPDVQRDVGDKKSRQIREGVYQGLMDSLVQLKEHHSSAFVHSKSNFASNRQAAHTDTNLSDMTLDQILTKFHSLLLSPNTPLNQAELYCVSYLFSFYQNHIAGLESKITDVQATNNEINRRSKIVGLDKSAYSEASISRDTRHELALAQLQSMAEASDQKAQQAKRNESMAIDRLAKVTSDKDVIEKELYITRDKMDRLQHRWQETQMEVDRLIQENKMLNHKCDEVIKEKRDAVELAEDVQKRIYKNEEKTAEVDFLRATNQKLKSSAEGLIEEVCKYKFRVKELELENNALKEIKDLAMAGSRYHPKSDFRISPEINEPRHKFEEFEQKFSEKMMRELSNPASYQKSLNSSTIDKRYGNPYTSNNEYSTDREDRSPQYEKRQEENYHKSPFSQDQYHIPDSSTSVASKPPSFKRPPSSTVHDQGHHKPADDQYGSLNAALPPKLPTNSSSQIAKIISPENPESPDNYRRPLSGTGSRDARRSSSVSITNMPAQQHLVDNAKLIVDLENELSNFQNIKMNLDGKLCRMKAVPKTQAERQEKEQCEDALDKIVKKMSEVRKRLREFK